MFSLSMKYLNTFKIITLFGIIFINLFILYKNWFDFSNVLPDTYHLSYYIIHHIQGK